ncbi:ATP-binding protein [Streptomyces sp. NPDC005863]|uniref:ATP-binding protein n=1 Tax=unclassified Streptomyces TaxID=2593676 RepID=UPI0034067920
MNPMNRGPEEYGHDGMDDDRGDGTPGPGRPPREPATPDFGQPAPAQARTVRLVSGDFLLTVNPVDGSEIEPCPPGGTSRSSEAESGGERPERPAKRTADDRAELRRAALPPVPPGPALPRLPLLERQEERERLVRLLARGRSVRLTGPAGSGRTALLNAVADDCADLAPDGVVRLSGYRRTPTELLHDLFAVVYEAPLHRPERGLLLELVRDIGAVVVLDDLEFGGAGLDELLDATPECAFLVAATPDVAAPSADSHLEEVFLGGLGRGGGLELLERAVGRILDDEEANWAGDLWFESEGLPLRFAQAGALLRQRDQLRADPHAFEEHGPFDGAPADAPFDDDAPDVPLPSLADGAAPAALLASRLSPAARATLTFAVALGGELPHQAHLPALVGDTHADAALAELVSCALVTPVGAHYRLAAGVRTQLESVGYADDAAAHALAAAQHYAWWAGHPSVSPERVAAEADAVQAALAALVATESGAAVLLARTAAPAFAGGLDWAAWERALRSGQEAARNAGEVAEEAYFHHELGILALCGGQLDRARAELEASIGLRGVLADKRGMISGRRALALVADRSGGMRSVAIGDATAGEELPEARHEESASPPGGIPAAFALPVPPAEPETVVTHKVTPTVVAPGPAPSRRSIIHGTRRNLVAAGAGALLAAVLGTVVTLGATSDNDAPQGDKVKTEQSATPEGEGDGTNADPPGQDSTSRPVDPGEDGVTGTADDPTPSGSAADPSGSPSGSGKPSGTPSGKPTEPTDKPTKPTDKPTKPTDEPTKPTHEPTDPPTHEPTDPPTQEPTPSDSSDAPSSPEISDSASRSGASPSDTDGADGASATAG